jgi:hypothetical protein
MALAVLIFSEGFGIIYILQGGNHMNNYLVEHVAAIL